MKNRELFERTRSAGFLVKVSLSLLIAFILGGTIAWRLTPKDVTVSYDDLFLVSEGDGFEIAINTEKYAEILEAELLQDTPFEEKLFALRYLLSFDYNATGSLIPPEEDMPQLSEDEYSILTAFVNDYSDPENDSRKAEPKALKQLAQQSTPPPFAHFAISLFYLSYSKTADAIAAAKAEIENHHSLAGRQLLIDIYDRNRMYKEVDALQADPEFSPYIDNFLKRNIALETMDWPVLIATLLPIAYQDISVSMLTLALISGTAWLLLLLRFNGALKWSEPAVKLAIPALLLGALSAHLTILAIYLQEGQFGFTEGDNMISQVIYCVAGIGLREELLKLLCFVPLIPFLTKRANELEILIVASMVGLGFAIEENIFYFEESQGIAALGRFVTANFLHLSLTGICGLTLCRAILFRGSHINTALSTFGLAVICHGAYDAFIIVPELADVSFASVVVFILLSYQYFIWLHHLRDRWTDPFSITAQFTFSLVIVFGASYILLAQREGPLTAFVPLANEVLGFAILLVMFYREIPEQVE